MRKYVFGYWAEKNDEPTDLEKIIEAPDIESAIQKFKDETRVYRRITLIKEIPKIVYPHEMDKKTN